MNAANGWVARGPEKKIKKQKIGSGVNFCNKFTQNFNK